MLRRQNFPALFLTRDSPATLPDGSGGRIRMIRNWHGCLFSVSLWCVVLCMYRPRNELIIRPKSPTLCRRTDYQNVITEARTQTGLYSHWRCWWWLLFPHAHLWLPSVFFPLRFFVTFVCCFPYLWYLIIFSEEYKLGRCSVSVFCGPLLIPPSTDSENQIICKPLVCAWVKAVVLRLVSKGTFICVSRHGRTVASVRCTDPYAGTCLPKFYWLLD
jgi:hypothetical protein